MANKIIGFLDAHAEKILWFFVIIVSLAVLFLRILLNPNYVEYDNKRFSTGQIDEQILNQARSIEAKLDRKPEASVPYDPCFVAMLQLFDKPIQIEKVSVPVPAAIRGRPKPSSIYSVPEIGSVTNVKVNYIRSAAWIPQGEVTETNPYSTSTHEVNDLDFVTVEAKYDASALYNRSYECFAGIEVNQEWRDPCLAKPIFAAVALERQELLSVGIWSEWTLVRRSRIDQNKRLFDIKESFDALGEGGLDVQILLFGRMQVQTTLLQPMSYQIASAEDGWYPPSIYQEFRKQQDEILDQERKQAKEEKQRDREARDASDPLGRRTATRGSAGIAGGRRTTTGLIGREGPGSPPGGRFNEEGSGKKTKTTVDVNAELAKLRLTDSTKYEKLKEPLTFWSFDDTVEPGKSYRYRTRLGVFNRVAGTNQLKDSFASLRNQVILWSDYSDVTEVVSVPMKLYVFPIEAQMSPKTVKIQISKYILGYWYSKRFTVKPGDAIGTKVAYEPEVPDDKTAIQTEVTSSVTPETIDYSTGAVLLDILPVNDWFNTGGNKLDSRQYFDMLYTYDGINFEREPIQPIYWAKDISLIYNEIRKLEKREKKEFRAWGAGVQQGPPRIINNESREIFLEEKESKTRKSWDY